MILNGFTKAEKKACLNVQTTLNVFHYVRMFKIKTLPTQVGV